MDKTLSTFLSLLHKTTLKSAGFSKKAATFSRAHGTHVELFNIQSSQWNGPSGRTFYVNCGMSFSGLSAEHPWQLFPGAQWATRIDTLVPGAPQGWSYSEEVVDSLLGPLGAAILSASVHMTDHLEKYRQAYLDRVERLLLYRQASQA